MTSYRRDAFVPITKAHVHSNTHISIFMCCVILYDFIFLIEKVKVSIDLFYWTSPLFRHFEFQSLYSCLLKPSAETKDRKDQAIKAIIQYFLHLLYSNDCPRPPYSGLNKNRISKTRTTAYSRSGHQQYNIQITLQ